MEDTAIPYELPEVENHSFFFIDQRVETSIEAKLHRHDAWELYYVVHGYGNRMAGDTLQPFAAGDVALIPPSMLHRWEYAPDSADTDGCVRYLMVAFSHSLVERCMEVFPELRNRLVGVIFPTDALKFGTESSRVIRKILTGMKGMDELGRLSAMFCLLPVIFTSSDHTFAGRPMRIERDVRRMQQIAAYVMAHYVHAISLDDIAAEVGMNRSAFCSYFKRCKGMTFSQFVTQYRLNTACELLKHSQKGVSEICYTVGFNDLPHFVRVFTNAMGMSPSKYRKQFR
ncbi:AraC family transcriptional regulator [Parabacteroides timonensis]|uniref:AraC family transcriptional regulator n=1 Tax=Parabacteroides timonensis TaxID=1871013 RepID=UPI00094EDD50|nr:AraC family transcriptional regulator [Parabacteroides timonensis]